jgi:carboxyl-terminal processing protease
MSKRFLAATIFFLLAALAAGLPVRAQSSSATISLVDRVRTATEIYHTVSTFFPGLSQQKFDEDYADYVRTILPSDDRREFDLASMELIARLHDGHSWWYDTWLDQTTAQPIGFLAYPLAGKWTVVHSSLDSIKVGDVITAIDASSIEDFYARNRKYISASSDRDAGVSLFDTPVIFPEKFTLTLADGRTVPIDRKNDKKNPEPTRTTEGRWLVGNSIAYIKVPSFRGVETQAQALRYLKEFHGAKAVILDVRGNPGMGDPVVLQSALMGKPYKSWTESTAIHGGPLLRNYPGSYPELATITTSDAFLQPRDTAYTGRLILLTDRICSCACEDFVMPFKYSKRATLVGETTAGTFSLTRHLNFDNGMMLNVAAIHHTFPDGSQFEGVGIAPDVSVEVTPDDLRHNNDVVLQRAIELAQQP